MTGAAATEGDVEVFAACRQALEAIVGWLTGPDAASAAHGEVEARLDRDGRELLRLAFQGHLDHRSELEARLEAVIDAAGVPAATPKPDTSAPWAPCSATSWCAASPTDGEGTPTCTRPTPG